MSSTGAITKRSYNSSLMFTARRVRVISSISLSLICRSSRLNCARRAIQARKPPIIKDPNDRGNCASGGVKPNLF
jgi:hypothetical protein